MKYRMTIIQPKAGGIKSWEPTQEWIDDFREELQEALAATIQPDPPFNPGEKQCKWCSHKANCEPHLQSAMNAVGIDWSTVSVQQDIAQQVANQDPRTLDDEKLRVFVEGIPLLKQAIKAVEDEGIRRFKAGHDVTGLKVVQGEGNRKYALEDDEIADKLTRMHIPKDVIWQKKLISPAQLENSVWQNREGERKSLSKKQIERINRDYIERPKGALRLVPEAAKGEPVDFTSEVKAMFKQAVSGDLPEFMQ